MTRSEDFDLFEINNGLFHKIEMLPDPVKRFSKSKQYATDIDYDPKNEPHFQESKHLGTVLAKPKLY